MYRNKKLTASANGESCVNCGINDGTIVWAHSNQINHGKGKGIKAHDLFGAYLCHQCHHEHDQGKGDKFEKRQQFLEWWEVSMIRACDRGYL